MQWMNARTRMAAAGAVLLAGAGYAAVQVRSEPAQTGPSPAELRELAARVAQQPAPQVALSVPSLPAPPPLPVVAKKPARRVGAAPVPRPLVRGNVPVLPPGNGATVVAIRRRTPNAAPVRSIAAPARPAAPKSPVDNIALVGVTEQGDKEVAWLVNLDNQERDLVSVGEYGFGLAVKDIDEDSVVLAHNGQQFTLRMGEKAVPVNEAPVVASAAPAAPAASAGGEGRRGRRQWGGGGGAAAFTGNRGWGGGRNRSGGSNASSGGRSGRRSASSGSGGGSAPTTFGGGRGNSGQANFNRGNSNFSSRRAMGGGNPGGARGFSGVGGGLQGQNSAGNSQFAAGASGPTSNPQTARRRGGQLIGGAEPIQAPKAIANPQTQRRLGTTSTGAAFGQGGNTAGAARNNQNRTRTAPR